MLAVLSLSSLRLKLKLKIKMPATSPAAVKRKLIATRNRKRLVSQQRVLKKGFVKKAIAEAKRELESELDEVRRRSNRHMRASHAFKNTYQTAKEQKDQNR